MKTPVAFFIFKRSITTEKVFEAIRQAKPSKLLVIADGPRLEKPKELENCEKTRAILNKVDWDCEVLKNYSDINMGCKNRVSSGLKWVFNQVEEAIILEDDCLPNNSFFDFCEILLEKYRYDERVFHISGQNVQKERTNSEFDYYFSRFTHCWGWATWRRAWNYYDADIKDWPMVKDEHLLEDILADDKYAIKVWKHIFQSVYDKQIDTWDYQLQYACWMQNGLSILPNTKLVENIGFGADGTHTTSPTHLYSSIPMGEINVPLNHPVHVIRNNKADLLTQRTLFDYKASLPKRVLKKVIRSFS